MSRLFSPSFGQAGQLDPVALRQVLAAEDPLPYHRRGDVQQVRDGRRGETDLADGQQARHRPGVGHGPAPAPAHEVGRGQPPRCGAPGEEGREGLRGQGAGDGARRGRGLPQHRLDEGAAAQNPLIRSPLFSAPAERADRRPTPRAPAQPPALELRAAALGRPGEHEGAVGPPGAAGGGVELRQDGPGVLPGRRAAPHEGGVPTPGVPVEAAHVRDQPGPQRIQVEIPHQLQKVRFRLHHDGFIPVLKEMAAPVVPAVEGAGVPREEGAHGVGQRARPRPDQQVEVVWEEGPGEDGDRARRGPGGQPLDEIGAIRVVPKDRSALDPARHHVVEDARGVQPGSARHARSLLRRRGQVKQYP